jgi:hypothetical protein
MKDKDKIIEFILGYVLGGGALVYLVFSFLYSSFNPPPPSPPETPKQTFARIVSGRWESTLGGETLSLAKENYRAVLVFGTGKEALKSEGVWHTTDSVVTVEFSSQDGPVRLTMEYLSGDWAEFLVPSPADAGLLKDSFMRVIWPEPEYDYGDKPGR